MEGEVHAISQDAILQAAATLTAAKLKNQTTLFVAGKLSRDATPQPVAEVFEGSISEVLEAIDRLQKANGTAAMVNWEKLGGLLG